MRERYAIIRTSIRFIYGLVVISLHSSSIRGEDAPRLACCKWRHSNIDFTLSVQCYRNPKALNWLAINLFIDRKYEIEIILVYTLLMFDRCLCGFVSYSLQNVEWSACEVGFLTSWIVLSGFFDDIFKNRSWAWQNLPVFLSNFFLFSFTPPIRSFRKFSNGTTICSWACAS